EPLEGLGLGNQAFTDFRSLHTHHPGTNQSAVRAGNPSGLDDNGAIVDGEVEVVRTENGHTLIKKDIIFLDQNGSANVQVPAPIAGYAHYLDPNTYGSVRIYTKPFGQPGAELVGQVLHMDASTFKFKEGERIEYGQPIGTQSGKGPNGLHHFGTHAHVELELEQFKKYVADLKSGAITQETYPAIGSTQSMPAPPANAMADGVLKQGEKGVEVRALQEQLISSGITTIDGRPFVADSDFGSRTKAAVVQYQRAHNLTPDGEAGKDTLAALKAGTPAQTNPTATTTSVPAQTIGGTTVLSNLIGRGEGGYNSYNRGNAGDAGRPLNLTDMTVGEIIRRQHLPHNDPAYLFAVGKFQMVGPPADTMSETVRALGINSNTKFTPDLQEQMFANYLIDGKRPAVNDYITGKSSGAEGLEKAQHALALEFASVGDPRKGGRGAYDGDSAGNSASITVNETANALNQMRTQYQANIANGQSPDAAYRALSGQGQTQEPATPTHAPAWSNAIADGMLRQGEHGPDIKKLQEQLNALHIKDKNGNALVADGDFGKHTKEAVKAFQSAHGLVDDGIVGKDTLAALKKAEAAAVATAPAAPARTDQSPLLSNPSHPDNKLYQQALAGMEKLPPATFKNEQERQNAAAAVTFEAKVSGMTKIDAVALNTNGSGLFAVQGAMSDPGHSRIYVDKAQAAAQPVEKSTQQLQQDNLFSAQSVPSNDAQRRSVASLS
ncbi:MAG: peptidoglycan-binding domain-containing protein, partial [Arenimonas sp.]